MESPWRGIAETDHSVALRLGEEMDPLYQHLHLYERTGGETFILRALKAFDPPIHFSDYLFRTSFEGEINCSVPKEERLKGRIGMNAAMTQLCKSPTANGVPVHENRYPAAALMLKISLKISTFAKESS